MASGMLSTFYPSGLLKGDNMFGSTVYASPLGSITLASDGRNLAGAWFEGQKYFGGTISSQWEEMDDLPVFKMAVDWLDRYFQGQHPDISELPLAPIGTPFRHTVWKLLCRIPYGQVVTYSDLTKKVAEEMGVCRMSCQAIGGAVGHNPVSIIIPCHRVIGKDGSLKGYAGGTERKIALLQLEGVDLPAFHASDRQTLQQ